MNEKKTKLMVNLGASGSSGGGGGSSGGGMHLYRFDDNKNGIRFDYSSLNDNITDFQSLYNDILTITNNGAYPLNPVTFSSSSGGPFLITTLFAWNNEIVYNLTKISDGTSTTKSTTKIALVHKFY